MAGWPSRDFRNAASLGMTEPLTSIGFDQYERHAITREVLERARKRLGRESLRVLDVGGAASALSRFLPFDRVVAVDVLPWSQGEYVRGTGAALPFKDASFDVVTCHDTLEHVPPALRDPFLREMGRVAAELVLVQGPFDRPGVAETEKTVMASARELLGPASDTVRFLEEHAAHGLPDLDATVAAFKGMGFVTEVVPNGALDEWFLKMLIRDHLQRLRGLGLNAADFDRWSNEVFQAVGQREPTYRQLVIAAKRSDLFGGAVFAPAEKEPSPARDGMLVPTSVVAESVAQFSSLVEAKLREMSRQLADRDAAIAEHEDRLAEAEARLAELEELLAEREAAARYLWGELEGIRGSLGYRLLERYRRVVRAVFPPDSWRGIPYRAARKALRLSIRAAGIARREGFRALFQRASAKAWRSLSRSGPRATPSSGPIKIPAFEKRIKPLTFPKVTNPRVSIVIPVYNKAVYTFNCLKSVLENTQGVDYEVIVIDDCSTDETPGMLASMENIRVLRNEENLGFLRTCNRGAALATGEYLLLLNNDTQVLSGWLEALLKLADSDPKVGAVGAKLVYPTGKLQEAGGIIWSDGSSLAYGRDDDPTRPEYDFVREVDYCSAACLLVRRNLWERAGGFDERFAPAYYEDTDLCFTLRQMGYRVLYQPAAVVIHREGTSSGGELSQRLQRENRVAFRDKWRRVLERDHRPPSAAAYIGRDRSPGKRVLVIDYHIPTFDKGGGELRIFRLLSILKQYGHRVTLLPADLQPTQPYTRKMQQIGIEVLYGPVDLGGIGPFLDLVVVSRPEVAAHYVPLIRQHAPQAVLVYDTVDLHWVRESRRAEVEGDDRVKQEAERLKGMELWAARNCDATIVVSPVEKEILEPEIPGVKVFVIPNVHPVAGAGKPFEERKDLLFVGYYPHLPNRDAMLYFIREVFPLVKAKLPEVRLLVVGPEPGDELESLASEYVIVTGWVKELDPYLDGARVFVCPLRYGAGIKGKIGESMAHGLPVVTTSIGAEGMGLVDGREALIADKPEEFAARVVELYTRRDLWESLSQAGLAHVDRNYSPQAVAARVEEMVQSARGGLVGRGRAQCNICGSRAGFRLDGGHYKEGYSCASCGSISRDRMLVSVLGVCLGQTGILRDWDPNPDLVVMETSGFRAHPSYLKRKFRYINLVFDDTGEAAVAGDLQRLPFRDGALDVVVSADVFEHVRDDEAGFVEVHRVLKDGGYFVLQVPALGEGEKTTVLVDVRGSEDVYLAPPEYHAPHALVYRYYGNDLADRLRALGFQVMLLQAEDPSHQIPKQTIIVAQKGPRLALGYRPSP